LKIDQGMDGFDCEANYNVKMGPALLFIVGKCFL
jgi:hypothetical protein